MRKTRTFTYYADPSHGWLKVPQKLIEELGIEYKFSHYSYYRNGYAYLEEDCDAGILVDELHNLGVAIKINRKYSNKSSKIRSYQHY